MVSYHLLGTNRELRNNCQLTTAELPRTKWLGLKGGGAEMWLEEMGRSGVCSGRVTETAHCHL